ncbi:hypothetical protein HDV00_006717 [Rhizophlyctis rosea]|nr:hypothetical protein HDV00_006717 [Rhizophlyctis rosea]
MLFLKAGAYDWDYEERVVEMAMDHGEREVLDGLEQAGVHLRPLLRNVLRRAVFDGNQALVNNAREMGRACHEGHFDLIRSLMHTEAVPADDFEYIEIFVAALRAKKEDITTGLLLQRGGTRDLFAKVASAFSNSELSEPVLDYLTEWRKRNLRHFKHKLPLEEPPRDWFDRLMSESHRMMR